MQSFSSDTLPVKSRATAWNALYSQQMNQVDFTPADSNGFNAQLSMGKLGPIQFARMTSNRSQIERTKQHIMPSAPRIYSFMLQAKGSSTLSHYGHEARLNEGDFALCDSSAPHNFTVDDQSMIIMLRINATTLRQHLPTPEQFCGLRLKSEVGLTSTMSATVSEMNRQLETGFTSIYDESFARHLLGMMSMSYTLGFGERPDVSSVLQGRHADVVRYVEDNLRDPMLTPASIAAGLRISPRYLRTIFAAAGEKVSSYIIRRRLEECGRQIRDPNWAGHTLTEIAFAWGFNSAAHFTRTFHEHFGMPPRDYRRKQLG